MPRIPIEDEIELQPQVQDSASHVTVCNNIIPTKKGNQLVRPGFAYHSDLTSFSGGYWTQLKVYAGNYEMGKVNIGNHLHRLSWTGSAWTTTSQGTIIQNTNNFPFSLAQDGNKWVCCKGDELKCGSLSSLTIDSVTTPPVFGGSNAKLLKVATLDNYFLALRYLGSEMFYTDAATNPDPQQWPAANYFQAFDGEDICYDMIIAGRQIVIMSANRTEVWENDGISPFSRVPGARFNIGAHTYGGSSIIVKGVLFWLSHNYELAHFAGGNIGVLPNPYAVEMAASPRYCIPSYAQIYGQDLIIFCFPNFNTYVYNITGERWSKWNHYLSETSADIFAVTSLASHSSVGLGYIGGTEEGRLVTLDDNSASEVLRTSGRTYTVHGVKKTGYIDHGSSVRKRSRELRVRVTSGSAGTLRFRWNDDPTESDGNDRSATLNGTTPYGVTKKFRRLGIYRTRRYTFTITGARAAFSDVEEDIDVLR